MISVRAIVDAVCEESGYRRIILLSARRHLPIVRARQIAIWLAMQHSGFSTVVIGRLMGDRDHTTVMHACKVVDRLCLQDREFRQRVARLDRQIALASEALELMQIAEADIDPLGLATEILQSAKYRKATTISVREIVALAEAVVALMTPQDTEQAEAA